MGLTDKLIGLNKRVSALEGDKFDENASIASISKFYGDIKVKIKIKADVHQYNICSDNLILSDNLKL